MASTQTPLPPDERIAAAPSELALPEPGLTPGSRPDPPARRWDAGMAEAMALPRHEAAALIFREGVDLDGPKDEFRGQGLMLNAFGHRVASGEYCTSYRDLAFPGVVLPGEVVSFAFRAKPPPALTGHLAIAAYRHAGQRHQVGLLLADGYEWAGDGDRRSFRPRLVDARGRSPKESRVLAIAWGIRLQARFGHERTVLADGGLLFRRELRPRADRTREARLYWRGFARFEA